MTTFTKSKDLIILNIDGQEHKLYGLVVGAYDKRLREYMDVDYVASLVNLLSNPTTNKQATDALLFLNAFLEAHYQNFYKGKIINWTDEQKKWNSNNSHSIRRDVMTNNYRGAFKDQLSTYAELADDKIKLTNQKKSIANKRKSKKS